MGALKGTMFAGDVRLTDTAYSSNADADDSSAILGHVLDTPSNRALLFDEAFSTFDDIPFTLKLCKPGISFVLREFSDGGDETLVATAEGDIELWNAQPSIEGQPSMLLRIHPKQQSAVGAKRTRS
jgi:hypothetical protein